MPPQCTAPKCFVKRNSCTCPNPWIEFLSRNAKLDGRQPIQSHAQKYRAARDAPDRPFARRQGDADGACKSNTAKLCTWAARRKRGHKDLTSGVVPIGARARGAVATALSGSVASTMSDSDQAAIARTLLADCFRQNDGRLRSSPNSDLFGRIERACALRVHPTKQVRVTGALGRGMKGFVVEGERDNAKVAVKIVKLGRAGARGVLRNRENFEQEVAIQRRMHRSAAMRAHVPKVHDAYVVDRAGDLAGVVVMERVDGIVGDVLKKLVNDDATVRYIANEIAAIVTKLANAKFVHGDLNLQNVAFRVVRAKPTLMLIDFGETIEGTSDPDVDVYSVWRWSVLKRLPHHAAFNAALVRTRFHAIGSNTLKNAIGAARPTYADHDYRPDFQRKDDAFLAYRAAARERAGVPDENFVAESVLDIVEVRPGRAAPQ